MHAQRIRKLNRASSITFISHLLARLPKHPGMTDKMVGRSSSSSSSSRSGFMHTMALLLLLLFSAAISSPASPADAALSSSSATGTDHNSNNNNNNNNRVNQETAARNLDAARAFLLQAAASSGDEMAPLFRSSLHSIDQASAHVSSLHWDDAKRSVSDSLAATSECFSHLHEVVTETALASSLTYLGSQIQDYLKAAQNELEITTSTFDILNFEDEEDLQDKAQLGNAQDSAATTATTEDDQEYSSTQQVETDAASQVQGCPASQVDGTKCQFSDCAKGYGLVSCTIGFAKGVVGGLKGGKYVVTSEADNPLNPAPGTFRYAANLARTTAGGIWITFSRSMTIALQDMLWVQSHTTIDGRGVNVTFVNRNLVLGGVTNVIIHNIQISNIRGSDTLHIFSGTTKVWVDHLTSFAGELGLASVLQGSTDVTISNSNLQNYNFNMLLGASDADSEDKSMRVTVYRNWFRDSMQRMPHCRWGVCHVVNNLYTNWGYYAIGGRANARVRTESNVFQPGSRAKEVTPWYNGSPATFDMTARIESYNDVLQGGATFHQFLVAPAVAMPRGYASGASPPIAPTATLPTLVQQCSGALFGPNLLRCLRS